jgi:hypothetical protein
MDGARGAREKSDISTSRRLAEINGWARSEPMAQQAAKHHARSVAKCWKEVKAEVVEVETLP